MYVFLTFNSAASIASSRVVGRRSVERKSISRDAADLQSSHFFLYYLHCRKPNFFAIISHIFHIVILNPLLYNITNHLMHEAF